MLDPHTSAETLIDAGVEHLRRGHGSAAEQALRAALAAVPGHPEALSLLGVALHKQNRADEAVAALRQAIEADDSAADAHYNLGEVLAAMGDVGAAEAGYLEAVRRDPLHPLGWRRLTHLRHLRGDPGGALAAAEAATAAAPDDPQLLVWTARLMVIEGRSADALPILQRAIGLAAQYLDARRLLARALATLKDYEEAAAAIDEAAKIAPADRGVLMDRVQTLYDLQRYADADRYAKEFVERFPADGQGHYWLGMVLGKRMELGAAAVALARSIELRPDNAAGFARLGELLMNMGRLPDAEVQLKEAIELDPKMIAPYVHMSIVMEKQGIRRADALNFARQAVELGPDDVEAVNWLAMLLLRNGKHSEAAEQFKKSLEMEPNGAGGLAGYGVLLAGQGKVEQGWDYLQRAMAAAPEDPVPVMAALFYANAHPDLTQEQLFTLHQKWAKLWHKKPGTEPMRSWDNDRNPDRVLRVGYLSPDLRGHSVAFFFESILRAHDRSKIHVVIFDNTLQPDTVTARLEGLADDWFRIVGAGDERVVELIRQQKIDILVDLAGHTADNRLDIFARHPAPVQVNYLGYPNTTGLPEIAYRFTDELADPPGSADTYHTEELIRLPGGAWCFRSPDPPIELAESPSGKGEPITFCSFNAVHKINQKVLALWAATLMAVPGSRMLFKASGMTDPQTRQNVVEGFGRHGVAEKRLMFVERTPAYRDHLKIYARCDVGLDTFPYNGTTTTCEAMWMGVPVITLAGDLHAARVGKSLLTRVGLQELVANSPQEFVEIAKKLAGNQRRLVELRRTMRERMSASRLMDEKTQAREMEAEYRKMWGKWCARMAAR